MRKVLGVASLACGVLLWGGAAWGQVAVSASASREPVEVLEERWVVSASPAEVGRHQVAWRARLKTSAARVGLLWPVPSAPVSLQAAPERPFTQLQALASPAEIEGEPEITGVRVTLLCVTLGVPTRDKVIAELQQEVDRPVFKAMQAGPPPPPAVLDPAEVGAVATWLEDNGLEAPAGLEGWLTTLAGRGWRLVGVVWDNPSPLLESFEVQPVVVELAGEGGAVTLGRSAPEGTPSPGQVSVYAVGPGPWRVAGWEGSMTASRPLPEARSALGDMSPASWFGLTSWLTHYALEAPPWTAEAPSLEPSPPGEPVIPAAVVVRPRRYIPIPLECMALAMVGGVAIWSWRRRKR